jgi:flagellar biosynthesis protein
MTDAQPPKKAVALSYDEGADEAPRVVASGSGLVAERIVQTAREAGVAIQENPALVEALAALDLGEQIPAELYPVVAEVLVWVRRVDSARGSESRNRGSESRNRGSENGIRGSDGSIRGPKDRSHRARPGEGSKT